MKEAIIEALRDELGLDEELARRVAEVVGRVVRTRLGWLAGSLVGATGSADAGQDDPLHPPR